MLAGLGGHETLESTPGTAFSYRNPGSGTTPIELGSLGVDVLTRAGFRLHRHGGLWAGLSAQIARLPAQRAGMVVIALDHTEARTQRLADSLIDELVAHREPPGSAARR